MKPHILAILPLALVIATFFAVAAGATMPVDIRLYPPQQGSTNAYYSVVFDGEGEADVAAKLMFQNSGKEPITRIVIEVPGTAIRLISAVQETQAKPNVTAMNSEKSNYYPNYYGYRAVYTTLDAEREQLSRSVRHVIKLKEPVAGQETGVVLLRYKATGYARERRGAFNFNFETAKVAHDIDYVRVAVNVQEGFRLKGGRAGVNYRPDFSAFGSITQMKAAESTALSDFSRRINYESGYVKETRSIDPWESFTVNGTYSKSWLRLNIGKAALAVLITAAVMAGLAFWGVMFMKMKKKKSPVVATVAAGAISAALTFMVILVARYLPYGQLHSPLLLILTLVLIAALLLAGLVAPPVFIGGRYGLLPALRSATVALLILFLIAVLIGILSAGGSGILTGYRFC